MIKLDSLEIRIHDRSNIRSRRREKVVKKADQNPTSRRRKTST